MTDQTPGPTARSDADSRPLAATHTDEPWESGRRTREYSGTGHLNSPTGLVGNGGPVPEPGIPDEAVTAAISAIARAENEWKCGRRLNGVLCPQCAARVALVAAAPSLRAAIGEQIAREIEALRDAHFQEYGNEEPSARGEDWGYTRAARVARGVGAETRKAEQE